MNYEAERAMNQKRLRMEGEPGHGVVQGNGLPLNYIDNGHQIPYQPYAGAYNTHYPPPDAFAAYGPPPGGSYAPQNLSYAPPAHQNYQHQPFQQHPQLHMQSHMVQSYGDVGVHKGAWPPQPHLLPPLDAQKPLDIKQLKPEIKLEPTDAQKRPHPEEMMGGDLDQPKIKIKTDIFKPDDLAHRPMVDKPLDVAHKALDVTQKPLEHVTKDVIQGIVENAGDKTALAAKPEGASEGTGDVTRAEPTVKPPEKSEVDRKPFSSPDLPKSGTMPGKATPGSEQKKRGRPKGSTNKPKAAGASPVKLSPNITSAGVPRGPPPPRTQPLPQGRPRGTGYQYAVRPFRKDFSGIQFRRRWSDDCLDSSHIPNEVFFGDVPVSMEVLFNYYDANAERERLAAQAAHIAAQKAAAAKLHAARLQASGRPHAEVTTVDSSSSDDSSGSDSDSDEDEESSSVPRTPSRVAKPKGAAGAGTGKRGRPPVPPELRGPGITDMKKYCKAAGIRIDYKKLTEGCTKNKDRVQKMMDLLIEAGLEGKPTLEKCQAMKKAKLDKREQEKIAKKEAKAKHKEKSDSDVSVSEKESSTRRMTRGATGVKPRQRIVISSDEEDDTPAVRRNISKLRSSVNDDDSD